MNTESIIEKLHPIYTNFKEGNYDIAKRLFIEMNIVDTEPHLAQSYLIRHLIWDLYEFLVIENSHSADREEIMKAFEEIF